MKNDGDREPVKMLAELLLDEIRLMKETKSLDRVGRLLFARYEFDLEMMIRRLSV